MQDVVCQLVGFGLVQQYVMKADASSLHEYLKHVLWQNKSTCFALCKTARPGHSVQPKIRVTESGTDQITILRCFLSFKTVVISQNSIVFKIKCSHPKNSHPSSACS
jgi:hypothetical protein